jgi:hypothetical protein
MRSLANNARQTSMLGTLYCDADLVSRLVNTDEKVMLKERCNGSGINIIDCHHIGVNEFIEDAGGLDFSSKLDSGSTPIISKDIIVVPKEWFDQPPDSISDEIVGIRISDLLSERPRNKWGKLHLTDKVHLDLSALSKPIFQGKKVILFSSGVDVVIETLWWRRNSIRLFEAIASGNLYAVTGMNFSLFIHECPLAQLINLNKSLSYCDELTKLGVDVIPHVYAVNNRQRDKWVDLLNLRPNIRTITINTQLQRNFHSMHEVELTLAELLSKTQVNILLNGRQPNTLINEFADRLFVANQAGLKQRAIIEKALLRNNPTIAHAGFM